MSTYYKAVRLDKTSHYDQKTKWVAKRIIKPDSVDECAEPCGHGIHCSPTLLDAVGYQRGLSVYCEVEPIRIIAQDATKARCEAVKCVRWLGREEQDEIAGFKLWEANHPINPLAIRPQKIDVAEHLQLWASVWASVRDSVGDSAWAYIGGLFPKITKWKHAESLGPDPWRPLLTLWYAGYLPSFDGATWRLHAGCDAKIVYEMKG